MVEEEGEETFSALWISVAFTRQLWEAVLSISCSGTKVKTKAHSGAVLEGPLPPAFSEQGGSFSNSAPNFVYMGGEMEQGVRGEGEDLGGWNQSGDFLR